MAASLSSYYSSEALIGTLAAAWARATNGLPTPWSLFVSGLDATLDFSAPYAAAITPKDVFAPLDKVVTPIANLAGLPVARYLAAIYFGVLLAPIFARIKAPESVKHLLGGVIGVVMCQWIFGAAWVSTLVLAGVNYLLMLVAAASPGFARSLPKWSFAWCLSFMTATHLWRLHNDYLGWSLDVSGVQMLLVIKARAPQRRGQHPAGPVPWRCHRLTQSHLPLSRCR